jgi:hypothetical protein
MNKNIPQEIQRFDLSARIQHIIMFTTFLLLSFTGWGLKYAYVEPSAPGSTSGAGRRWPASSTAWRHPMLLDFIYHQFTCSTWRGSGSATDDHPMPGTSWT